MKFWQAMKIVSQGGKVRLPVWDYDEFVYCVKKDIVQYQIQISKGDTEFFQEYIPSNDEMLSIFWEEVYDEKNLPSKWCECSKERVRKYGHACRKD